jgi:hypothetical protein
MLWMMKMRFNVELGLHERHVDPYLAVMCHRGIHIKHVVNRHDEEWLAQYARPWHRAQWRRLQVRVRKQEHAPMRLPPWLRCGMRSASLLQQVWNVVGSSSSFGKW